MARRAFLASPASASISSRDPREIPLSRSGPATGADGFLHRIVNGGGYIDREYGVGRGRIDLLIRQPYTGPDGTREWQREALELEVWRDKQADPLAEGLEQLDAYLDRLTLDTGVLVIFDRRTDAAPIGERTAFTTATTPAGRAATVLRT
ncbi:hypothetical protein [Nocardia amamiensis]|uniref:hypothetical protein n=1 Tax=Nocardia amamiensis TaxID=404578 RepID=UPI000830BC3C|nr:hypothetical protein [Nocardia amamiensis]